MTALTVKHRTISISNFDIVMIKNFAIIFSLTHLPATHTLCLYRVCTLKPVYYIYIMDVLLYNMIAAKPVEIIPVSHLVFHLGLIVFAFVYPYTIIIPPGLCRSNI